MLLSGLLRHFIIQRHNDIKIQILIGLFKYLHIIIHTYYNTYCNTVSILAHCTNFIKYIDIVSIFSDLSKKLTLTLIDAKIDFSWLLKT